MLPQWNTLRTRRVPVVTYVLIAFNLLAFLWELALLGSGQDILAMQGFVPARMTATPLTEIDNVLTSMFMHSPDGWWHLGGNMLFLCVFGDNVERALGRGRFVVFYLLAGAIAAIAHGLVAPTSVVPMVGASGAISGVLAAYVSLYPKELIVLNLPAWLVIAAFFAANLLSATASDSAAAGIAFYAHIGGFLAGLLLVRVMLPAQPRRDHALRTVGHDTSLHR